MNELVMATIVSTYILFQNLSKTENFFYPTTFRLNTIQLLCLDIVKIINVIVNKPGKAQVDAKLKVQKVKY